MNRYINFFVRDGDVFCPIGTYRRYTPCYQVFAPHIPSRGMVSINSYYLKKIEEFSLSMLDESQKYINSLERKQQCIGSFNDPLEEKVRAIEKIEDQIEEELNRIERIKKGLNYIDFFLSVVAEAESVAAPDEDPEHLYVGFEIRDPKAELFC